MVNRKRKKTMPSTGSESDIEFVLQDLTDAENQLLSVFESRMKVKFDGLQKQLNSKDEKISNMEQEILNLRKKVDSLQDKLEDTEACERRDCVVLSGSEVPAAIENEKVAKVVSDLVKNKIGVIVKQDDIVSAYRLGKRTDSQAPDGRSILVKFCKKDLKHDLLKACKTVKPRNIFINESLTRTRNVALYGLRQAKKRFPDKIDGCGSSDGRVYVWVKPPNPDVPLARNSKIFVNTSDRFSKFCTDVLNCEASEFITTWPNF